MVVSHSTEFNPDQVIQLFERHIIQAPLELRSDFGDTHLEALLWEDGKVEHQAREYSDIHQAMCAVRAGTASSGNAWQFWTAFSAERQTWVPLEHLRAVLANADTHDQIRTSDSHPLRIDAVAYPASDGKIGMTFCPGKRGEGIYGGHWERDIVKDLNLVAQWNIHTLISLMEAHEFALLGVPQFEDVVQSCEFHWLHLPIQDMQIPGTRFEQSWNTRAPGIHQQLKSGANIVIHCRGGLGRTGLLAARLLVEAGIEPALAVRQVRQAREHAIETYAQEHYILTRAWET